MTPELVADLGLDLGEGPIWHAATRTLIFVDSTNGLILRLDPASGDVSRIHVGPVLGAAIPRASGGFVASSVDGLLAIDPDGRHSLLVPIEQDRPESRMNDAKCDSHGRLFSGTLSIPFVRGGNAFYSIDAGLRLSRQAEGVTVSNGIAWNADETLLYYVDTASRGVDVFDYDLATGTIANRRRIIDIDRADGLPDGITVDAQGHLWVALYLGGAVRRYTPDGRLVAQITLPVTGVTSCNFGGDDLTDLYITTARHGVPAERLANEPHAGALFRCRPGVAGLPSHDFAG